MVVSVSVAAAVLLVVYSDVRGGGTLHLRMRCRSGLRHLIASWCEEEVASGHSCSAGTTSSGRSISDDKQLMVYGVA